MKILVGSDIHSNLIYANYFVERIKQYKPDKVILLGDLMDFADKDSIKKIFNKVKIDILCVEGNCDRYTANFGNIKFMGSYIIEKIGNRQIFFTHGHIYNKNNIPSILKEGDVFVYGHLHVNGITNENGLIFANAGSIGKPRENSGHSFIIIDENSLEIREVEYDDIINRIEF
ncbi:MAG: YfcE family phosphodiesterase [Clostridia bacterium]